MMTRQLLTMALVGPSVVAVADQTYDLRPNDRVGQVREYEVSYGSMDRGPACQVDFRIRQTVLETGKDGTSKVKIEVVQGRIVNGGQVTYLGSLKGGEAKFAPQPAKAVHSPQGGVDRLGVLTTYNPPSKPIAVGDQWTVHTGATDDSGGRPVIQTYELVGIVDSKEGPVALVRYQSHEDTDFNPAQAQGEVRVIVKTGRAATNVGTAHWVYFFGDFRDVKFAGRLVADLEPKSGKSK